MAGFRVTADIAVERERGRGTSRANAAEPDVLELRVHGVNNTTPAELLDLPVEQVELVAGDKLGSFWMRATKVDNPTVGHRGHVPDGIRREAYSWGGMVRTTPNFGGVGAAGVIAGVIARVLYAMLLPFSIGNAVQWSRRLTRSGDTGRARLALALTAGLARLFGLVLTLLFTATAATVSIDMLASQCAVDPALCAPVSGLLQPTLSWPSAGRLALFAIGPVAAALVLWVVSAVSRQRYDVLPGMESHIERDGAGPSAPPAATRRRTAAPAAALSQPAFWANRITAHLARLHLAAAIAFTAGLVAVHAAMRGFTTCTGIGGWATCIGDAAADTAFQRFVAVAIAAGVVLLAAAVAIFVLPTQSMTAEEGAAAPWSGWLSAVVLGAAAVAFGAALVLLVLLTPADAFALMADPAGSGRYRGMYGAGVVPLVLVVAGAVLALSGIAWRPWRGRSAVAWRGCTPAVFMTLSLVVATGTSAILVVTVGDALNTSMGAASLVREPGATSLDVPSSFVALGAMIVTATLAGAVIALLAVLLPRRGFAARAQAWGAPARSGDPVIETPPGVLPVSQRGLFARIHAKRVSAARLHLAEPAAGLLTALLGAGVLLGAAWTIVAYTGEPKPLWDALPGLAPDGVRVFLDAGMWGLAALGLVLVAVLASGASSGAPRPLGIVWDITCFLPRTGHPFGPPSFAERAVPEIAGRLYAWLAAEGRSSRTAVLVAHSMGGVLAVSSLGLLASSPQTRDVLGRISLLTFGVQLRAFFGRMLPDLLGPEVLGTRPALAPRLFASDPWARDVARERVTPAPGAAAAPLVRDRLEGTLLPAPGVRWISLWRLTDFLGFPAMSTARGDTAGTWINGVDRYATELDTTGYMIAVGTHSAYFRAPEYDRALAELAARPHPRRP